MCTVHRLRSVMKEHSAALISFGGNRTVSYLAPPLGLYVRCTNLSGSALHSATPRKQPMPMASQSAFSSTSRLITSGADSAIACAALAMCVGVQMLGGASTRYLQSRHPLTTAVSVKHKQSVVVHACLPYSMHHSCLMRDVKDWEHYF